MVKIWKVVWGVFMWDRATRRVVAGNVREALEKAEKINVGDKKELEMISIELDSESDEDEDVT